MKYLGLIAAAALALSSNVNATLLTNGGFESPDIASGWTYLDDSASGWQGDNIEVWQSDFLGVTSYEGSQHGELNAHPYDGTDFSIFQTFDTSANALYDFSLAYRARSSNNESFRLEIFTGDLANRSHAVDMLFTDHTTADWSTYANSFYGTGLETYIMLTSINPDAGTVGNFIDAIVVSEVSEPATLALFGLGLIGLTSMRRHVAAKS